METTETIRIAVTQFINVLIIESSPGYIIHINCLFM